MHLHRGTVVRDAMGSIGTGGFATLPGLVLVFYLTDTLGISTVVADAQVMSSASSAFFARCRSDAEVPGCPGTSASIRPQTGIS